MFADIAGYRKYQAAVIIDQYGRQMYAINQTIAFTFIAKDGNQLYITSLKFNEIVRIYSINWRIYGIYKIKYEYFRKMKNVK